ncbi:serine O-acetyltransferase [Desulfogranum marinum]|jgi:serine O-acetyltransferase|uniref:serine O-acetyltransferase n=1 Tax=Desulfogranum marinum TaxID=453220 RepID=UPI0019643A1A|nr:serine acetyltransferase [Desulfogranum marinum]MBM9512406.1 serine acetyltransferase [Desulfogranum marinum]
MVTTIKGDLPCGQQEIVTSTCSTDCSTDAAGAAEIVNPIPAVVEELAEEFKSGRFTSHIEPVPIPSKEEVIKLVEQVQRILFPGYFTSMILRPENLEYYLGQQLSLLYENLARQISSAIRHDCFRHNQECTRCGERSYELAAGLVKSLPEIRKLLESDIEATLEGDPAAANRDQVIFSYPGLFATMVYRLAHKLHRLKVPLLPRIMSEHAFHRTAIDINPAASIGGKFFIDHGAGVVIGATTKIGCQVRIYQGVTLGALSLPRDAGEKLRNVKRHPTIEDNVIIYANATILGGETVVGARSVIGGNVWVTESISPDTKVLLKQPQLVYLGQGEEI